MLRTWLVLSVRVCVLAVVCVLTNASAVVAQTTALYFDSQPGDYIGQGVERTYTTADAAFAAYAGTGARLSVIAPDFDFWWYLNFDPPTGSPFGVGTYESAYRFSTVSRPRLDVYGDGRGCNVITGRFVVLEYMVGASGAVTAFAADFEQHCEDGPAALFGAIRYNSSISDLVPFGGNYPLYRLTVPAPAHGRVTGSGLDCGSGGTVCQLDLAAADIVTLTATADVGHFFAGWAGDCSGAATTTVRVNGPKVCTALFEPFITSSPRTLLLVDSQPGDPVGGGTQTVLSTGNSSWSVSSGMNRNYIQVNVSNDPERWRLSFSAPEGVPLAVGTYDTARAYWRTPFNGLEVTGSGSSCTRLTGRFVIRELVFGTNNTVVRFAADFEQHCNDISPGLFGSVRYNSTIPEVDPFDGNYPQYELTITPPALGRVTGGAIDCGGAGSACTVSLGAAAPITLTAQADPGSIFTGWTGDCRGGGTTVTININGPKTCSAHFESLVSSSPRNLLFMDSQAGDYLGQGRQWFYVPGNSFWSTSSSSNSVSFTVTDDEDTWRVTFRAPTGQPLTVGTYIDVHSWFSSFATLDIWGYGRSCSNATGRFVVHEIAFAPGGALERFAADFELHCNDAVPGVFGSIRYNAAFDPVLPFGGTYPLYQLTLQRPTHGRITGPGLDCGTVGTACETTLGAAARLTLSAEPDSGYLFAGWTGDCHGAATTSIHVNGPKACGALFEPLVTSAPRTLLYLDSEPSEYVGQGGKWVYSASNSRWTVTSFSSSRNHISITVEDSVEEWELDFQSPANQPLAVGEYVAVRRYSSSFNGLSVTPSSRYCSALTGRFVILELVYNGDNTVQRFAADFEQHCNDSVPGLFGAIRYNSTISETRPFAGAYPLYRLTITPPLHGRVTGTDLSCGGGGTACVRTLSSASQVTVTAAPDFGYVFMGWTDDCIGAPTITVHVNGPKRCAALFEPAVASLPRTVLRWDAAASGNTPASSGVFSPANSRWSTSSGSNGSSVRVQIVSLTPTSEASWYLDFYAPTGESLQIGRRYTTTNSYPTAGNAGLSVSRSSGSSCGGGEFTVRELALGPQNTVLRLAVDFVANCGYPPAPGLTGSLQYNSLVDVAATTLTVEPSSLRFAALHNGATITTQPSPQTVRITLNSASVGWTAVASQPWIQLSPSSGTGSTIMTVTANLLGGLANSGGATGNITVTLTNGTGTSRTVNLTVTLHFNGTTSPPIGVVDTPLQNISGVTGAIPMTGWALDDLEIESLTICRAPAGGEAPGPNASCGGAAEVFVGNGVFIEGARPDVLAAYPNHPRADRAGWGFMLLTNMLPNSGNGTFVFSVYARDAEGFSTRLGTRTMTCDNAHATAPFGTIDTPGQGATASGSTYINFGWALTPNPKSIAIDGSTLMVYVDGLPIGRPTYNNYRADIATLFPGLANSNGTVGYRFIDTTTLPNGLHTISWSVTDSAGVTSGLGSRYFRVANGVAASTAGASTAPMTASTSMTQIGSDPTVDALPLDDSPIVGRRGWSADAPWRQYNVGRSGRAIVRGEEVDRFELLLGDLSAGAGYTGYVRAGDRLRPLPVGSQLNPTTGVFTWSPGVGFVGTYDLVFIRTTSDDAGARREVRFILAPKGSGHVGAQVVIDTPRDHQEVAQPFMLAGWAADRDASTGPGIDTVHVWAYPVSGGAPVFLGAAATGGGRPDVAAVLGDQFRDAGWGLTVQGLAPGAYDLAVFAWSNVTSGFVPAQVVRTTVR